MRAQWMRWTLVSLLVVATSIPFGHSSLAEAGEAYRVSFQTDIVYYDGADFNPGRHILDVYRPVGLENAPVLMFVHGGSWSTGNKSLYGYVGRTFAQQGYLTVIPNYRLSPAVQHPAHVRDVARAYDWTVNQISHYGGDPLSIVLSGHSAGGHLVALLALNERFLDEQGLDGGAIQGVIGLSGVYDVTDIPTDIISSQVFTSDPDARRDASPIDHVDDDEPPFLLLYAQFDIPTLDTQAHRLHDNLIAEGNEARIRKIGNRIHSTIVLRIGNRGDPTTIEMLDFLGAKTRQPQATGSDAE